MEKAIIGVMREGASVAMTINRLGEPVEESRFPFPTEAEAEEAMQRVARWAIYQSLACLPEDIEAVDAELRRAKMHGNNFASLHEAYAVIEEELDEIHDLMRMKRRDRNPSDIRKELIQIAAMAHKALQSMDNFIGGAV